MRNELPDADVQLYPARHTELELSRVQDEISTLMSEATDISILSCGVQVARNAVTVGVSDVNSPQATALRTRARPATVCAPAPGIGQGCPHWSAHRSPNGPK